MEMLVIFVVALLVLGPQKLPEAGRQVGRALAEFRRWSGGVQAEMRDALQLDDDVAAPAYDPATPLAQAPSPEAPGSAGPPEPPSSPRSPSAFPDQQSFT